MGETGGGRGGRGPARAAVNGGNGAEDAAHSAMLPDDPAELEQLIDDRRRRLAVTVDELARRARPGELARSGVRGVGARLRAATCTEDDRLRVERVAAVATATVTVLVLLVWRRRSR